MDGKKLFAALWFLVPGVAIAECTSNACVDVKIQELQVTKEGLVWIQTSGIETLLTTCTPNSGVFIKLDTSTQGGRNIYSALLSTQAQGKTTVVRVSDNISPCQVEYVNSL